jgi:hypothetical protein
LELGAGLEREQAWSLELGAGLERERAWSLERLEPDPCRTQVSIFFFVFILFVCLWSYAAQDTQRYSAAPQTTFASSSSFLCNARSSKE